MNWDTLSYEQKRGVVLHEANYWCEMCGTAPADEVDHIWPKSLGGTNRRVNLRAACLPCNRAKGAQVLAGDIKERPAILDDAISHFAGAVASNLRTFISYAVIDRSLKNGNDDVMGVQRVASEALATEMPALMDAVQGLTDGVIERLAPPTVGDILATFFGDDLFAEIERGHT